jgi:iron complex outermembrane receptor protein
MKHLNVTLRGAVARGLGAASVVVGLLGPALGVAQNAQPAGTALTATRPDRLDDIVVTARKVEENLQQVPVSVTAISSEDIAERNIQGLRDIARYTPGFSFENFTGPLAAPIIRGQTQTRVDLPVQNVASFFNGVYLQRGYMIDASLLDVERVEVIKGPQSALYGRNAFSGAINYITRRPGDTLQGRAEVTAGNYERLDYKGSISGPLTSWLGVTAAIGHSEQDGTWSNNHPLASQGTGSRDNVGGWEKDAALIGFTLTPLETLSFDGAFSWSDLDVEHMPAYTISGPPGIATSVNSLNCSPLPSLLAGNPLPGSTQNRLYCGELRPDVRLVPANTATTPAQPSELAGPFARPPGIVIDPRAFSQRGISRLASLKAQWDATEQLAFIYLGGYTNTDVQSRGSPGRNPTVSSNNFVAGPFVPLNGLIAFDSQPNGGFWSYSHELRAEWKPGGLVRRAMLGAFTSRSRDDLSQWSQWGVPNSLAPPVQTLTLANNTRRDEVDSVFGLVTLDVTERMAVTAEARYTKEDLTLQVRTAPGIPLPSPFDSSAPILRTQFSDFDYVTPRLSVDYRLTDANMVYGVVGKGVKSGGQNAPGRDPAQDTYEPEENWTVEVGSKNDLLGGTLRLNVAAYYIDWTGLQGSVARNYPDAARPDCVTACVRPAPGTPVGVIVGNLGDASVYGIEVSGAWLATQAISVDYSFAYQDAKYDDGQISQRAANSGNCNGIVCAATVRDAQGRPIDGARIGGNQLERQPKIQAGLGAELTFAPAGLMGFDWSTRADLTYQSKQYVDELNLAWVPARTLLDASINATRGPLYVRLWAKNLTDEEYVTTSLFLIGTGGGRDASYVPLLGERRTYGLTVGLKY